MSEKEKTPEAVTQESDLANRYLDYLHEATNILQESANASANVTQSALIENRHAGFCGAALFAALAAVIRRP